MKKTYRAILIDPELCRIEVVETDASHSSMCELIGASSLDHFRLSDHPSTWDYGWLDDTGLSRGVPIHAFRLPSVRDPFAGRCLIIGANKEDGKTCDVATPIEFLRSKVEWIGLIKPDVTWDKTDVGQRSIVTYERVRGAK